MSAKQERSHIGVGLYSIAEAARILGVHHSRIRLWAKPEEGLVPRYFEPSERTITFLELMELHFIKMFRDADVSLPTIRKASAAAARKYDTAYPFCVKRFDTDGRTIFATLVGKETSAVIVEDLERSQLVFEEVMKPFFHKLEYCRKIEPARYWPLNKSGRIVLDPTRKFGKPVDSETGIPVGTILDALNTGEDIPAVAKWLGVPQAAVRAAVEFDKSLAV